MLSWLSGVVLSDQRCNDLHAFDHGNGGNNEGQPDHHPSQSGLRSARFLDVFVEDAESFVKLLQLFPDVDLPSPACPLYRLIGQCLLFPRSKRFPVVVLPFERLKLSTETTLHQVDEVEALRRTAQPVRRSPGALEQRRIQTECDSDFACLGWRGYLGGLACMDRLGSLDNLAGIDCGGCHGVYKISR